MLLINNKPVKVIKFNGGEVQVNLDNFLVTELLNQEVTIKAHIKNSDDIMALIQTKTILDKFKPSEIKLYLPRLPYAQSDRAMVKYECSGLKTFANIINSLNFDYVCIDDPHSDVAEALINKILIRTQSECLNKIDILFKIKNNYDYIISPDGGALKKIYSCAKLFNLPVIEASKHRDINTGNITHTSVNNGNIDLTNKSVLICDDIIDGGRTFIELAKVLKEQLNVKKVDLYATHGLFSKGFDLPFIDTYYIFNLWEKEVIPSHINYLNSF